MADVSSWSPLDSENILPPPDGWPEFMMPSAVNNCARAMMGATRRMYDGMLAGSLALPYLKLNGGGTVTGSLVVTGAITGGSISSNSTIYAAGGISSSSNLSGTGIYGSYLNSSGGLDIGGTGNANIWQANAYDLGGVRCIDRSVGGTVIRDEYGQWVTAFQGNGNNYYCNVAHRFSPRGNTGLFVLIDGNGLAIHAGSLSMPSGGSISTANLSASGVYAGYITSSGNVNAAGTFTGGNVSISGRMTSNDVYTSYIMDYGELRFNGWGWANGIQFGNNGGAFWANATISAAGDLRAGSWIYLTDLSVSNNSGWWHFNNPIYSVSQINSGGNSFGFGWGQANGAISSDGGTIYSNRQFSAAGQIWAGDTHIQTNGIVYFNNNYVIGFDVNMGSYPDLRVYINGGYVYEINSFYSDVRLKKDITPCDTDALTLVQQLDMIEYDMQGRHYNVGVTGQQLKVLMPDTVIEGPEEGAQFPNLLQVQPLVFAYYLCRAVQQLAARVETLEGAPA